MRRRRLRKLTTADIDAYTHVFALEYGERYRNLIVEALKFCKRTMEQTGVGMDVRAYIADVASKVKS